MAYQSPDCHKNLFFFFSQGYVGVKTLFQKVSLMRAVGGSSFFPLLTIFVFLLHL